jgi:DNA-binding XRE family transcriptional regulator
MRTFYAITRCLEIISEATRRLSPETKARHPDIPWRKMSASGNIYRHDYEDVAHRLVRGTVHEFCRPCASWPKPSLQKAARLARRQWPETVVYSSMRRPHNCRMHSRSAQIANLRPHPVGDLLRGWRNRRAMSHADLAFEAGISIKHLSYVETGKAAASRDILLQLAAALEHIPSASNRGDSQRSVDERVWRP